MPVVSNKSHVRRQSLPDILWSGYCGRPRCVCVSDNNFRTK